MAETNRIRNEMNQLTYFARMCVLATALVGAGAGRLASAERDAMSEWVQSLGGSLTRNAAGDVVGIDLQQAWVTDVDLRRVATLPSLEEINLAYTKVTDLGLEELIPLQNVKVLNLYYAEYVSDLGIAHLKHWKNLEYLNVRGTKVTSSLFEHIAKMSRLRFLDVAHSRVNDDFFELLANLEQLEHLSFGGNKMSGAALPMLKLLPSLRELRVGGGQRTDSGLWSVAVTDFNVDEIAQLEQLEVLDLREAPLTDRGVTKLNQLRNLQSLDLCSTRVSAKGIAALSQLPQLRQLKLWQAKGIDDTAVPHFLAMPQLEVLEIPETNVTAGGLFELSKSKTLNHLFVGDLGVSEEQVAELRAAMPGCLISWWKKPDIQYRERSRRRE
jgi:hypothetical protein